MLLRSYKKLTGWEFGHWLTANFTFPAVTRANIVWSFSIPLWCNKHLSGQNARIIIAFEFFGVFVSTRKLAQAFFWRRKSCACFRNNISLFRPSKAISMDKRRQQSTRFCFKNFVIDSLPLMGRYSCKQISSFWLDRQSWCAFCRDETRLDGVWGKKQVWRPRVRTWCLSEANVPFWKKAFMISVFLAPRSDSVPGNCAPCPPRYVTGVMQ